MRNTMLTLAALVAVVGISGVARANGPVPPVTVGSVVIVGVEAERMINELSHHRHARYHAGDALDFLYATPVAPTASPGIPMVTVNGVPVVGHEAEEMIDRLSHLRHHGHWRAGMPLDWLGIANAVPVMAPVPMVPAPMMVPAPVMVAPAPVVVMAPPPPAPKKDEEPRLGRVILGLGAMGDLDQAAVDVGLTVEGKRWGFNLNGGATVFRADESDRSMDLKIIDAHLVFAPVVGQRGRVRIEGGAALAMACDALLLAPELGLSGDVRIWGPLGVSGFARGTIWPYKRFDAFAGVYGQLWKLRAELGWREMRMEADLETTDQSTHVSDRWGGPYLGVSLVF